MSIKFDYIPFTLTDELIKECLFTKSELLEGLSKVMKKYNQQIQQLKNEHNEERNDVYIYKTVLYSPKSKPPNKN